MKQRHCLHFTEESQTLPISETGQIRKTAEGAHTKLKLGVNQMRQASLRRGISATIFLALSLLAATAVHGQLVNDGGTNTLLNVNTNILGDVTVGTNGSFTLLVLSDNASVTNSANGIIGLNATASSNEVRLISPTSRWRLGGTVLVGSNGVSSRLVVSNGALLESFSGNIGPKNASGNHSVLITGTGSLWSNQSAFAVSGGIFNNSKSNQVVVSDGATLFAGGTASVAGYGSQVFINGAGSRWVNQSDFTFGGSSNRLEVRDGATLITSNATITDLTSSDVDAILLTGAGTVWTNNQELTMGYSSHGVVTASNGAAFLVGGRVSIGALSGANGNTLWVTDPGSRCIVGSDIFLGSSGNLLVVSNGGFASSSNAFLAAGLGGSFNSALIVGAGSVWSNKNILNIGGTDHDNQLVVSNGGTVIVGGPTSLGTNFLAYANSATVTDPGSAWTNLGPLKIGDSSYSNRLVLSNGGRLESFVAFIGYTASSSNNQARVTGSNSFWNATANLEVGLHSKGNQFFVSNGGRMRNTSASIGSFPEASNNLALVTGSGSSWINTDELRVGYGGSGNLLLVTDAGLVSAQGLVVGRDPSSLNNLLVVNTGTLICSNSGGTAALDVRHGTNVLYAGLIDADLLVLTNKGTNFPFSSFGNSGSISIPTGGPATPYPSTINMGGFLGVITKVTVTLSNLTHLHPDDLDILLVSPAGQKVMLMSDAGGSNDITNVRLTFDDSGSFLPDSTTIVTGTYRPTNFGPGETLPSPAPAGPYSTDLSSFNGSSPNGTWRLYVNDAFNPEGGSLVGWGIRVATDENAFDRGMFEFNGGTLVTRGAVISNGAPFVVGGSGTNPAVWNLRGGVSNHFVFNDLSIGPTSSFNQVILSQGAVLTNSDSCILGRFIGANSNSATVTGASSRWSLADGVIVGSFGSANRLTLSNGAALFTASSSVLGIEIPSSNNEAIVTGPGTFWSNTNAFTIVGYAGQNNRLLVADGATLTDYIGSLGHVFADGSNNLATITGTGSLWSNIFELYIGNIGASSSLVVSNNAVVSAGSAAYLGFDPASTKNRLAVNGGTLCVTNPSITGLLDIRRGTNVLDAGTIKVDILRLTNTQGFFEFNGGTLSIKSSVVNNNPPLRVGNGNSPATLNLAGNGNHVLVGGLIVSSNAVLTGNGSLSSGPFTVQAGGQLSPGTSIGIISVLAVNSPLLQGRTLMEISRNGSTLTNDLFVVTLSPVLTYGGTLTVTNIGPGPLLSGDRFQLFSASSYDGAFAAITLPPLPPGLTWTNKLLVDGSIQVAGAAQPVFASITLSGTNLVMNGTNGIPGASYSVLTTTNIATPSSNWISIATNQFSPAGGFSFTNALSLAEPQRYFRIRTP